MIEGPPSTLRSMAGRRRCPQCGATNLDDAGWCGQCYSALPSPEAEEAAGDLPTTRSWRCRVCGSDNDFSVDTCSVCGTSMLETLTEQRPAVPAGVALRAAVVPGLGLVKVGMPGEGFIAALLTGFSVMAGVVISAAGEPLALVMIGAGIAIWLVAARDAFVVASNGPEAAWLQPRTLTIVAVLIILVTAFALLRAIPTRGET